MLILFYNSFFGSAPPHVDCGRECEFTTDRDRLTEADVVVFHLPDAQFIGDAQKYPGQTWVAWTMESTINTPILGQPKLMRHFDLRMTFSRGSDVWCGYMPGNSEWTEVISRPLQPRVRHSPMVMFQSATVDRSGRNAFCAELMTHMPIDSYGKFLKNRELGIPDKGFETKLGVIGGYKFALGAENTIEADYVTEKFFQPLLAGTVPVYRGAPNVADYAPGDNCFVDASAFSSPAELAAYLRYLDSDDTAYASYLSWRTRPLHESFVQLLRETETQVFCRLAELVERRPRPRGKHALLPFGLRRYAGTKLARAKQTLRAALG